MRRTANVFQDRMKAKFGLPTVMPKPGESFDWANDCFLSSDGRRIEFRCSGWNPVDVVEGRLASAMCDALVVWNRNRMHPGDFAYYYGDDPTECGFGG